MTKYAIRPRQDFSLATLAKILQTLKTIYLHVDVAAILNKKTNKHETLIFIPLHDADILTKAVHNIIAFSEFKRTDFKIVEVAD